MIFSTKNPGIIFLLLCWSVLPAHAQTIEGRVTNQSTGEKLAFANLSLAQQNLGTSTNEKGQFRLKLPKNSASDTLLISFIGYQTQRISLSPYTEKKTYNLPIALTEANESLNEVIVSNKKIRYRLFNNHIKTRRKTTFPSAEPFGHEVATFIKNEKELPGKLLQVKLHFKKKENKQFAIFKTYYRINFYKNQDNKPGELLTYQSVVIKPKNKNHTLKVNLEKHHIKLPKNGLYIGIEAINPQLKSPQTSLYLTTPNLLYTHHKKRITFIRFRGKEWHKNQRKSPFKKGYFSAPLLDLKVVYEK